MNQAYNQFKNYKVEDQDMTKKWRSAGASEEMQKLKKDIADQEAARELGLSTTQLKAYKGLLEDGHYDLAEQLLKANQAKAASSKYPSTKIGWEQMKKNSPSSYFSDEAIEAHRLAQKDFATYHSKG